MAARCDNCGKGRDIGHNVSHAKNRSFRLFRPNLQKLRVLKNGISIRVRFCTDCIQRLKKFKQVGAFSLMTYGPTVATVSAGAVTTASKKHIDREAKKIEEIMKKEEKKWKEKEVEEKVIAKKKAEEKVKIEELVGKK